MPVAPGSLAFVFWEVTVAFKVNYGLERAERNRLKQAKKEAKAAARKAHAAAGEPETDEFAPAEDAKPEPADE
jgi:hypothetical protein